MDKNHIEGVTQQHEWTRNHTVLMTPAQRRGSGSSSDMPQQFWPGFNVIKQRIVSVRLRMALAASRELTLF
jgi:hypothetical protein